MIRFGPAGIPLSCKGRTLRDGIEDVHGLGLNAMEVQMVRVNVIERFPDEEEVGLTPMDVESDLIMEIVRTKNKKEVRLTQPREKIKEDDTLITLASGIAQNFMELRELGRMGREMDVQLSMHTPYYMDLASNTELTARCMDNIRWAGTMTDQMDGCLVVTHLGLAPNKSKKQAKKNITENISSIMDWWKDNGLKPRLGFETSGRQEVFGSLDEVLEMCDDIEGTVPVINFAHVHAREEGALREPQDFGKLLDRVRDYIDGHFYTHFSGVEHEGGNEKRITPIKKGDLKFEPLADYLAEENPNITIISSSPLLEHDAMYMKVIYERVLTKRVAKETKVKKSDKGKDEDLEVEVDEEEGVDYDVEIEEMEEDQEVLETVPRPRVEKKAPAEKQAPSVKPKSEKAKPAAKQPVKAPAAKAPAKPIAPSKKKR
ncbi:MAG: putative UV damage endonuclease [Methanomassiliicoccales archaeon PtaU1.Bin030]|nr:MAG: putative UV damage endonuclease [Methanomassiliicoccales archaeon PtaU1.Bin030]